MLQVILPCPVLYLFQDRGVKEDELQSILNYLLTIHEVRRSLLQVKWSIILRFCCVVLQKQGLSSSFIVNILVDVCLQYLKCILQKALQLADFFFAAV